MKAVYDEYGEKLVALFKEIFMENDSFINMIFEKILSKSDIFIKEINGELATMAYGLEKTVKYQDVYKKCIYVYAVGVKQKYRGIGLSKKIMSEIYDYYKDKNISFLYLVPANKGLFSMYEKLGYKTEFYLYKEIFSLEDIDFIKKNISVGKFNTDYKSYLKNYTTAIIRSATDNEAILFYTSYKKVGNSGFLYERNGDEALIRESFIYDENDLFSFLYYLRKEDYKKATVTNYSNKRFQYAMALKYEPIDLTDCYTNMNFD